MVMLDCALQHRHGSVINLSTTTFTASLTLCPRYGTAKEMGLPRLVHGAAETGIGYVSFENHSFFTFTQSTSVLLARRYLSFLYADHGTDPTWNRRPWTTPPPTTQLNNA